MSQGSGSEARSILSAWRENPEWRKLFVARASSLLGGWFNSLALVHLTVGGETGGDGAQPVSTAAQGALALAIVFILKQVPITILGPLAGVVADRFDRRKICILCEAIAALVVCGFLLLEPGQNPGWVWTLTILQVATTAFFLPAYQALLPKTVTKEHLTAAGVASSASWSIMFALGMALGGVVMAEYGWRTAIVIDAFSYVIAAVLVAMIRVDGRPRQSKVAKASAPRGMRAALGVDDFRDGLRYVFTEPQTRRLVFVKCSWGAMGSVTLILALLGRTSYQIDDAEGAGVAYLWFCRAIGTLFGPLLAYRVARENTTHLLRAIQCSLFLGPLFYLAFGAQSDSYLGGALVATAHLGGSTLWVISTVLMQKSVPDELRGRTFAADFGLVMLSSSASLLFAGIFIEIGVPIQHALFASCAICLVAAALWSRGLGRDAGVLHARILREQRDEESSALAE